MRILGLLALVLIVGSQCELRKYFYLLNSVLSQAKFNFILQFLRQTNLLQIKFFTSKINYITLIQTLKMLIQFLVRQYIYYCSWLLLKPFLPEDHYSYYYFPDQKYVYYLPSLFLLLILQLISLILIIATVMSTLGYILINSEAFSKPQVPPWVKYGYQGPKIPNL